jgi:hypothetical protein
MPFKMSARLSACLSHPCKFNAVCFRKVWEELVSYPGSKFFSDDNCADSPLEATRKASHADLNCMGEFVGHQHFAGIGSNYATQCLCITKFIGPVVAAGTLPKTSELERNPIVERVKAGMRRAKLEGRRIGRTLLDIDREQVIRDRRSGMSLPQVVRKDGISRASVCRLVKEASATVHLANEAA